MAAQGVRGLWHACVRAYGVAVCPYRMAGADRSGWWALGGGRVGVGWWRVVVGAHGGTTWLLRMATGWVVFVMMARCCGGSGTGRCVCGCLWVLLACTRVGWAATWCVCRCGRTCPRPAVGVMCGTWHGVTARAGCVAGWMHGVTDELTY